MSARLESLTKKKDFDLIFKTGRSSYDLLLGIKTLPNQLGANRIGFIISTKVSKKAVERNRLKRQLRVIFREELAKINPGIDFIVLVLKAALGKTVAELEKSAQMNLKKLRIYNKVS